MVQYTEYEEYLKEHTKNIRKAWNWIKKSAKTIPGEKEKIIDWNIYLHDDTKTVDDEYYPYYDYFYNRDKKGKCKNKYAEKNFRIAKLKHFHRNPDHWQHWVLYDSTGFCVALDMPYEYIVEMVCNWWSYSWAEGDLWSIFDWYIKNEKKMKLSKNTTEDLEYILAELEKALIRVKGERK